MVSPAMEGSKRMVSPAFAARVKLVALEPVASTAEELDAYVRREIAKWEKVIREANIQSGR